MAEQISNSVARMQSEAHAHKRYKGANEDSTKRIVDGSGSSHDDVAVGKGRLKPIQRAGAYVPQAPGKVRTLRGTGQRTMGPPAA